MGATQNKAIRNHHAQQYIQAVFANRLREAGFVCPEDNLLCWYRIINREVIQSVCFFSCWSAVPVMMSISYGTFPAFTEPFHYTDVYCSDRPDDERFYKDTITEGGTKHHFAPYSKDILVYAPTNDGRGLYTLDSLILPKIENVDTIEKCYRFHQQMYCGQLGFSTILVDEAIFLGDDDAYAKSKAYVEKAINLCSAQSERQPKNTQLNKKLKKLNMQKRALFDGTREEYLLILEQQKEKNLRQLGKKLGISL